MPRAGRSFRHGGCAQKRQSFLGLAKVKTFALALAVHRAGQPYFPTAVRPPAHRPLPMWAVRPGFCGVFLHFAHLIDTQHYQQTGEIARAKIHKKCAANCAECADEEGGNGFVSEEKPFPQAKYGMVISIKR